MRPTPLAPKSIPAAQPSDQAVLRQLWRQLPWSDREAVARWVEASDHGPGGLAAWGPDWRAVRVGDGLCRRLAETRQQAPHTTPQELLRQVLAMAAQQA